MLRGTIMLKKKKLTSFNTFVITQCDLCVFFLLPQTFSQKVPLGFSQLMLLKYSA